MFGLVFMTWVFTFINYVKLDNIQERLKEIEKKLNGDDE